MFRFPSGLIAVRPAKFLGFLIALATLALAVPASLAKEVTPPPPPLPVHVKVGIYLLNLSSMNEKAETYDASFYLSFQWQDSRLAFSGTEPQVYLETAAEEKLTDIWWPQLEYSNASAYNITNQSLDIQPDGTVNYYIGLNGTFRTDLDLRRFPFDHQSLDFRLGSFYWTSDKLVFEQEQSRLALEKRDSYEALHIRDFKTKVIPTPFQIWGDNYSEFHAIIDVTRNFRFYLWTVFGPIALIFFISCTAFYVPMDSFADRISICLTSLLACIATQFAISFNLPQIDYMTTIDRIFVITYFSIALIVFLTVWTYRRHRDDEAQARRIGRLGRWIVPTLYVILVACALIF